MEQPHFTSSSRNSQPPYADVIAILDSIDVSSLVECLESYRPVGRKGYSILSLWRAYMISFILGISSTSALTRRLYNDVELRKICGFTGIPHRTTFSRFISRLSDHKDEVDACMAQLTSFLQSMLPAFGSKVAVDSTFVRTHSNPNRKSESDPEASWTVKNSASAKNGKEYRYGYKFHMLSDAVYGLPIYGYIKTAKSHDTKEIIPLLDNAENVHHWFSPKHIMADKGYDSQMNHKGIFDKGIVPIIHIRRTKEKGGLYKGLYDKNGAPVCNLGLSMEYIRTDPDIGHHQFRCAPHKCSFRKYRGSYRYCSGTELWVDPVRNLRVIGVTSRSDPEWKELYSLRQSIERIFKSMKESRRLEGHFIRGMKNIALHAAMSMLAFQATALMHAMRGEMNSLGWMVRYVG